MSDGDHITRDELEPVARAHRAYVQDVLRGTWLRLSDGEYRVMVRAAREGDLNVGS